MRKNALTLAVAGALLVAAGTAGAATKTATLGVSAVVNAQLHRDSSQNLAFGGYDGTQRRPARPTSRCAART